MSRSLILVSLFLATFFLRAPAAAQSTGQVTGRVTDAETGRPLPGVNILVSDTDDGSPRGTSTGPQGRFTLGPLDPGTYTIEARFVGYTKRSRDVDVSAGTTTKVQFALAPRTVGLETLEVTAHRQAREAAEEIQRAEIREAKPRDAGELLRNMSGMGAVRRGPIGLDPVLRGLRESQVGVYVDGMRTFPAGPARMDSPLSHTGPFTMQSVEVAKGRMHLRGGAGSSVPFGWKRTTSSACRAARS